MYLSLLKSLISKDSLISESQIKYLINKAKNSSQVKLEIIPLNKLTSWSYKNGSLIHESNNFFKIKGIDVSINKGLKKWSQPIIYQPEVGILGLIATEIRGVMHFLIQLKVEPGNINFIQLSPTIQATRSNYLSAHKGKSVPFLELFRTISPFSKIIVDQLQSEQGSRFLGKRNRNIIIYLDEPPEVPDNEKFIWLTLNQIKKLSREDNLVNMDLRTVISCLDFSQVPNNIFENYLVKENLSSNLENNLISYFKSFQSSSQLIKKLLSNISILKSENDIDINFVDIAKLKEWNYSNEKIFHYQNMFFDIIGSSIEVKGREVSKWDQPLVAPKKIGNCVLFIKKDGHIIYCLIQFKLECGNKDIIEIGPTIQTSNFLSKNSTEKYLYDLYKKYFSKLKAIKVKQSEEGGRFYREENINSIMDVSTINIDVSNEMYMWVRLSNINHLLHYNNFINIQLRSLLSLLSPEIL